MGTSVAHATVEEHRQEVRTFGGANKAVSLHMRKEGGGKKKGVCKPSLLSSKFLEADRKDEEEESQRMGEEEWREVERYHCEIRDESAQILCEMEKHALVQKESKALLLPIEEVETRISQL